jgi:hypothetical protein
VNILSNNILTLYIHTFIGVVSGVASMAASGGDVPSG